MTAVAEEQPPLCVDWQQEALDRVREVVAAAGLVLLGEVHGVAENALVIEALLRRLEIRQLSLEWPPALRPQIDAFLAGGELDLAPLVGAVDGRCTAQHYALLRRLHREDALDRLVLADAPTAAPARPAAHLDWNERDSAMAAAVLRERAPGVALLHCGGNLHTQVAALPATPADGTAVPWLWPMGAVLAQTGLPVVSIEIDYRSGSYFNLTSRHFTARSPDGPLLDERDGGLRFALPVATAAPSPWRHHPDAAS